MKKANKGMKGRARGPSLKWGHSGGCDGYKCGTMLSILTSDLLPPVARQQTPRLFVPTAASTVFSLQTNWLLDRVRLRLPPLHSCSNVQTRPSQRRRKSATMSSQWPCPLFPAAIERTGDSRFRPFTVIFILMPTLCKVEPV